MGLPDLLWTGWIIGWWADPPTIHGPPGTAEMMRRLEHTFDYDIKVRNANDRLAHPWQSPVVIEYDEAAPPIETSDFRALPFRVEHSPVDQAFGVRFDTESGSIAFSGDTSPQETLAQAAQGVDLLVHEVYDSATARQRLQMVRERLGESSLEFQAARGIYRYHTGSEELGAIARLADTPRLVLNHVLGPPDTDAIVHDTAVGYSGQITVGEDLQTFTTG